MSKFSIQLYDKGRYQIRHELAGVEIITDSPPEYGGKGRSFSPTDLVSAALGSCTLSTIVNIIAREGYDPKKIKISVNKKLSEYPKMIKAISLEISYPQKFNDELLKKLKRAIETCPVKRSLNKQVETKIRFITG